MILFKWLSKQLSKSKDKNEAVEISTNLNPQNTEKHEVELSVKMVTQTIDQCLEEHQEEDIYKIYLLISANKCEEAIALGHKLLEKNPQDCELHRALMEAYFKGRNITPTYLELSTYHAKQAILCGFNKEMAPERLAINLEKNKCFHQSLQLYNLILENKDFKFSRLCHGDYDKFKKRKESALKKLDKALDSENDILFTPQEIEQIIENIAKTNEKEDLEEKERKKRLAENEEWLQSEYDRLFAKPANKCVEEELDLKNELPINKDEINFVAIDLETANAYRGSICEIGIAIVEKGEVVTTKSWLVQPKGNQYDYFNIAIHGITPEDTQNSPSFPEVWKEVYEYLKGKTVVAHNTSFDMYALRDAFDDYGMEYPEFDYYCTLRIARYIIKGLYSYSLDIVLDHLNIPFEGHHKAGNDSRGCAELLLKCIEKANCNLEDMEKMYHFHRGKFATNTFIPQRANNNKPNIIRSLQEHSGLIDEGNYFYGKSVCFTGTCIYGTRKELLQKIKDLGGIPCDNVTSKTDVLVVGQQDYRVVGETGMSSKQQKALELLDKGQDIEILSETEFLSRL